MAAIHRQLPRCRTHSLPHQLTTQQQAAPQALYFRYSARTGADTPGNARFRASASTKLSSGSSTTRSPAYYPAWTSRAAGTLILPWSCGRPSVLDSPVDRAREPEPVWVSAGEPPVQVEPLFPTPNPSPGPRAIGGVGCRRSPGSYRCPPTRVAFLQRLRLTGRQAGRRGSLSEHSSPARFQAQCLIAE
jgi:hypothetical protein